MAVRHTSEEGPDLRLRAGRGDGGSPVRSGVLGARLASKLGGVRVGGGPVAAGAVAGKIGSGCSFSGGRSQRVIVKVSYASHMRGGGKLAAHAAYLGRDGAAKEGELACFYDATRDQIDGVGSELGDWGRDDPRHFRIIVAPESASRLEDMDGYVREVMVRLEQDLGIKTEWVAVNHWNTDNPHAHIILRGRTQDGAELRLPRAYLSHGLRTQAQEIATEMLGERSELDDRLALDRAVQARGLTRLDRAIESSLDEQGQVLFQALGDGEQGPWADALRGRARELASRGLAFEARRNVLAFKPGWTEALEASGPLDITKAHGASRGQDGPVVGEVLGLEERASGNTAILIDTGARRPVLANTDAKTRDLLPGAWVRLEDGELTVFSHHSLEAQLDATAFTALDRELERRAAGKAPHFSGDKRIEEALAERAEDHIAADLGVRDPAGRFQFKPGARKALEEAELDAFRAGLRGQGFKVDHAKASVCDGWIARSVEQLHQGPVAVLKSRTGNLAVAALSPSSTLEIGQAAVLRGAVEGGLRAGVDLSAGLGLVR